MDYSKEEFQLFFSGVESDKYFGIVSKESNAMLMSYLYLQRKGKKFLAEKVKERPDLRLLIDSGAHTFIDKQDEYKEKTIKDWEDYLEKYTKWIRNNKEHIFACVELDIDVLVGIDVVEEWRDKYFHPLEEEGIQVIYVWHSIRGLNGWEDMCRKYRYIGFSYNADKSIDDALIRRLFMNAKKHQTRIHGFGITGFDAMITNPYYTVDSSTWLVGTQFGEVNFFDGRKMTRLKKDKWKRQYKNKLIKLGANWNLAEREEPYELIRINVLTFLEVQKHVRKRIKMKSYWLKKDEEEEEIEAYERGTIPSLEWFDGDTEDWKSYAKAVGIDTKLEKETAIDFLFYFYAFITFDKDVIKELEDGEQEALFSLCDTFKLEGINTTKKAIEALPICFKEHAEGKRHELEYLSEEKEGTPEPKERDEYVEEESYVTIDLDKKECDSILAGLLPHTSSMPEVDAYDEELNKQGIAIIRDDKGKFLKGQQTVRKPKKVYGNVMPKFACDTCYKAQECPKYKAGYICAFNKVFKKFNTRNKEDITDAMYSIVEANIERMQRMMMFETMDNGMADPAVSQLMDTNMKYLTMLGNMEQFGGRVTAQRRIVVDEKGNTETVETVTGNPQQGGILQQIFGGMTSSAKKEEDVKEDEDTIDVTPEKRD